MAFELATFDYKGLPWVRIAGELMDTDALRLSATLRELSRSPAPAIVVDVSALEFIDSHGMGLLVYHHTELRASGRWLLILNENADPGGYIRNLLESTGMDQVLDIKTRREQIA